MWLVYSMACLNEILLLILLNTIEHNSNTEIIVKMTFILVMSFHSHKKIKTKKRENMKINIIAQTVATL